MFKDVAVPLVVVSLGLSQAIAHESGPGHSLLSHIVPVLGAALFVTLAVSLARRRLVKQVASKPADRKRRRAF